MRFLLRALRGFGLLALTLALIGWGAFSLDRALEEREAARKPREAPPERVIPAEMAVLAPETAHPRLPAYGRVSSARTLILHAGAAGRLVELSPALRDGGRVAEGELLWRIDPATAQSALARAEIALAEAEAEARLTALGLELARKDFEGAEAQRALRERALERQEAMRDRGIGSETAVETAAIALVEAERQRISRERALIDAENRSALADIALRRTRLAVKDAARELAETEMRAPFAGLVAEADAVRGRRVVPGDRMGLLIDPTAYEAAVEAPGLAVARLLDEAGDALDLAAEVRLAFDPDGPVHEARLLRVGAASGPSGAGRTLHLALGPDAARGIRPGDFVTAEIIEPPVEAVARLPARALDAGDAILILGGDDRLERLEIDVLRRLGDDVLAVGAPFGEAYLVRRRPQLGPGVKVEPILPRPPPDDDAATETDPEANPEAGAPDADRVALTDAERARLAALVEAETALPAARRARLLADLAQPDISRDTLERIERLSPAPTPSDG